MNTLAHNHYLGLGKVFHGRRVPKPHTFTMSVYMLWISLDETEQANSALTLGKLSRFAPEDYWQKNATSAKTLQHQLITEWQTRGLDVDSICVLTNPRSLNTMMNPLSVFYCYCKGELVGIIAEVTNTPWGERHHYFLVVGDADGIDCTASAHWQHNQLVCQFAKTFHVSPFNPMDMGYEMRFKQDADKVSVVMHLTQKDVPIFDASLNLSLQPLTDRAWRTAFWKKPWITMQVRTRIYFEALRLAIKRTPFFGHPNTTQKPAERK